MATTKAPAKRKTSRKPAAPRQTVAKKTVTFKFSEDQWAALLDTYSSLKAAGLPIPIEIAEPVDSWLSSQKAEEAAIAATQATEAEALAKEDSEGPKWVRNLYTSPFSLRLQRQSDPKTRRIELKPRGTRGDMFPLEPGDENDHVLRANLGRVEVIGDGAAKRILEGQTHNIQQTNTTLAMITNEIGEPIKKMTVETEFNQQGVVVGYIDPNAKAKAPLGGILRPNQVQEDNRRDQVSHFVPTGGNPAIVSQGPLTNNAKAAVQDKLARIKGLKGRPEDILGLTVSVTPTQGE